VAARATGPGARSRALGLAGWRGPFCALAVLPLAAVPLIARQVAPGGGSSTTTLRSELGRAAVRPGRLGDTHPHPTTVSLSALAVRFSGVAPTSGVALSVAAYDLGTAVGSRGDAA
jgi:hypothetical protein